jgi:hypothetical protein
MNKLYQSKSHKTRLDPTLREGGITVAEFRDLVGGNRKICLLLLAQYDSERVTKRDGDFRFLVKEK